MNIELTFLTAAIPLIKRFELVDGVLVKHSYPTVKHLTSSVVTIHNTKEMYEAIKKAALDKSGPCLFKGELIAPLVNESRKNMGKADVPTQYAVLDFDNAPFASAEEAMKALGLSDISYVWQFSSSAKLDKNKKTLNGHAFILLSEAVHPRLLRSWFMYANLRLEVLKNAITLSKGKQALHWPLDVVVSDNNRIIYIAEPAFKGIKNPLTPTERLSYVKKKLDSLPISRIPEHLIEALKQEEREHIKALRAQEGLPNLKSKAAMKGEWEVQSGVGAATTYQVIDDGGEFIRYNLNDGDSQAYWHPRTSFELLHSFKGEPSMLMKEILPQRYAELCREQNDVNATPNEDGDLLFAFREKVTGRYWKGTWNPERFDLDLHPVNARVDLEDFMQSHGRSVGNFVPEWHMLFDPRKNFIVDEDKHIINTFVPSPLMRGRENIHARKTTYPTIQRVLNSAVGVGAIQEHFLNWLACIVQHRCKTGTAWLLHGTQGTGKGVMANVVMRTIIGAPYVVQIRPDEVDTQFNSWMDRKLLVYCDEIEVDFFMNKSAAETRLKMSVTESFMPVRLMRTDVRHPENFVNLIFGSNKPQPVQIPLNDRRFNVGTFQTQNLELSRHDVEVVIPGECEAFAYYLATREADLNRASKVMQTEDRAAIQQLGITSVDEFAHDILVGNLDKLWEYMPDERAMNDHGLVNANASAYASIMKRFINEDVSKISRDELALLFGHAIGKIPEGANKFTTYLRHHGITMKRIWHGDRTQAGIETTWKISPETRKELLASVAVKPEKMRRVK